MSDRSDTPGSIVEHSLALVHYSLSRQGDRSNNEDAYCHVRDGDLVSFAVADGMGGKAGGAHASALAMESIRKYRLTLNAQEFSEQFTQISSTVMAEQESKPEFTGMCTTLAELRIDTYTQQARWAHWGDTRIYWFRHNELLSMTEDHSVVQSLVSAGLISEDEARNYPQRNVLLGAAGSNSEVGPCIHERTEALLEGDAFLICSDGLWSVLHTAFIERLLAESSSVQGWIEALMDEVKRIGAGHNDNYTATGIWITANSERTFAPPHTNRP